jgi:hypothetical protein
VGAEGVVKNYPTTSLDNKQFRELISNNDRLTSQVARINQITYNASGAFHNSLEGREGKLMTLWVPANTRKW